MQLKNEIFNFISFLLKYHIWLVANVLTGAAKLFRPHPVLSIPVYAPVLSTCCPFVSPSGVGRGWREYVKCELGRLVSRHHRKKVSASVGTIYSQLCLLFLGKSPNLISRRDLMLMWPQSFHPSYDHIGRMEEMLHNLGLFFRYSGLHLALFCVSLI